MAEIDNFLYLYASIAQSMAAVFAVGGVFVVYRLQVINQQLTLTYDALKAFIIEKYQRRELRKDIPNYHVDPDVQLWLQKDIMSHLNKMVVEETGYLEMRKKNAEEPLLSALVDYYSELVNQMNFEVQLRRNLVGLNLGVVFFMVTALYFLVYIGRFDGFNFIFVTFVFGFMILVAEHIKMAMAGPRIDFINNIDTNHPGAREKYSFANALPIVNKVRRAKNSGLKDLEILGNGWL